MADKLDQTLPRTEDSRERGLVKDSGRDNTGADPSTYTDLGRSEELGGDEPGDIADEGTGHRG